MIVGARSAAARRKTTPDRFEFRTELALVPRCLVAKVSRAIHNDTFDANCSKSPHVIHGWSVGKQSAFPRPVGSKPNVRSLVLTDNGKVVRAIAEERVDRPAHHRG